MQGDEATKELSPDQHEALLRGLKARFEKNMDRHQGLQWAKVQAKLEANPEKLWSLHEMERTGGEPDVVGHDQTMDEYIYYDCSAESPKGRRSICYDREALDSRKEFKPADSALGMAADMGIELLTEAQYRELQKLGKFDTKTSSWLITPAAIRKLGGAIFADRRYDHVFVYHNGAESYYAGRGVPRFAAGLNLDCQFSMRTEQQILELILNTARADDRIRAVILNGSRADPDAPRDIFQDYDIVYLVTDVAPFVNNLPWIARFGELMILQMPDAMGDAPHNRPGFTYLAQFADGNRIDLTFFPVARLAEMGRDSLSVLLLDKDGIVQPFDPPHGGGYLPDPPTAKQYADCCNEFWWVSTYVAKGLWREEITYARYMQDQIVREQLMKMLAWYIGVETGFAVSPGKFGKYFQRYLEPELWTMLLQTYADADYAHSWDAQMVMGALFRRVALLVAEHFGYDYPHGDDARVSAHLVHVRHLPNDASEIY